MHHFIYDSTSTLITTFKSIWSLSIIGFSFHTLSDFLLLKMPPLGWRKSTANEWISVRGKALKRPRQIPSTRTEVCSQKTINRRDRLIDDNTNVPLRQVEVSNPYSPLADLKDDSDTVSDEDDSEVELTNIALPSSPLTVVDYSQEWENINASIYVYTKGKYYNDTPITRPFTEELAKRHVDIRASANTPDDYVPLQRNNPPRPLSLRLSSDISTPIQFFLLFFTVAILNIIVDNTNSYVSLKRATGGGGKWRYLTLKELQVFIAITIYFSVYKIRGSHDIWLWDSKKFHKPLRYMSRTRYDQIKTHLHVSPPSLNTSANQWFIKLSPLYEHLRAAFKRYIFPP